MMLGQLLILAAFSLTVSAYDGPAPLKNVEVRASIEYAQKDHVFTYTYNLTNPATNNGEIDVVSFSISREITDSTLSDDGLKLCDSPRSKVVSKEMITAIGASAPEFWSCHLMPNKTFAFAAMDDNLRLHPGSSISGFQIVSRGLPAIRAVDAEPALDTDKLPSKYSDDKLLEALESSLLWHGKTVGPRAPPRALDSKQFVDYLYLLNEQSAELKWIKRPELQQTLEQQLKAIKSRLVAKDPKQAKKLLTSFLQFVRDQNGSGVTPEGFALLYYNAQYLADHL
jgi:hypothetical protein